MHKNVELVVHLEIIAHRSTGLQGILFPSVRSQIMSTLHVELLAKMKKEEEENLNTLILAQNFKDFINSVLNFYSVSQS